MTETAILDFLRHVRKRYASTTYDRTAWEMKAFYRYLEKKNKCLHETTKADIEEYLLSMSCNYDTKHRRLLAIRALFTFLQLENPTAEIVMRPFKRIRIFKEPHRKQILDAIVRLDLPESVLDLRNRLVFEMFYGSGIRRAELTRLNIEDVNLENSTMQVLGKGSKMRLVPITAIAADILRRYLEARRSTRGPLFVSYMGRRMKPQSINVICTTKIGIRPHLLRHACASHMLKNGCDIRHIQELLGHEELTTTQIYTHTDVKDLKSIISRLHPMVYQRARQKVD
jgi:site-specific recombinase XerD